MNLLRWLFLTLALASPCLASSGLDLARSLNEAFVEVAEKVTPAVVVITVTGRAGSADLAESDSSDDYWRKFHEQFKNTPYEKVMGQGSGVIIRKDGYILTNRHVVEDADQITVRLHDGRRFPATVRGVDKQSDVAVIKIEAIKLPVARLADSSRTRVGEFAIAIGTPYNLDYSVTIGHVSAKGRANVVPAFSRDSLMDQDFIQTDASMNPGNSGGPLLNLDGEVIGINTLIHGLHSGIGFAIPSNLARAVADQLIATGKFSRPWLGVTLRGVKELENYAEVAAWAKEGVVVTSLIAGGPAVKSELRPGDVITRVDGQRVNNAQELRNAIRSKKIGVPVTLKIARPKENVTLRIAPGEYAEPAAVFATAPPRTALPLRDLGMSVHGLTPELVQKFAVKRNDGVLVLSVEEESPADRAGIQPGDIITAINDHSTLSLSVFQEILTAPNIKDEVRLTWQHQGEPRTQSLKLKP